MLIITAAAIFLYCGRQLWGSAPSLFWDRVALMLYIIGISTTYVPPGFLGVPMFCGMNTIGQTFAPGIFMVTPAVSTVLLPYSVPETLDRRSWPKALHCNTVSGTELQWPTLRIRWQIASKARAIELVEEYKVVEQVRKRIMGDIDAVIQRVCWQNDERTLLTTDLTSMVLVALNDELASVGISVKSLRWIDGVVRPTNSEADAFYNTLPYRQSMAFRAVATEQADRDSKTVAPRFMAITSPCGNFTANRL